jgi:hypothetical protein
MPSVDQIELSTTLVATGTVDVVLAECFLYASTWIQVPGCIHALQIENRANVIV